MVGHSIDRLWLCPGTRCASLPCIERIQAVANRHVCKEKLCALAIIVLDPEAPKGTLVRNAGCSSSPGRRFAHSFRHKVRVTGDLTVEVGQHSVETGVGLNLLIQ